MTLIFPETNNSNSTLKRLLPNVQIRYNFTRDQSEWWSKSGFFPNPRSRNFLICGTVSRSGQRDILNTWARTRDPDWIRIQLGQWIRFRIRNPDPDQGEQKWPRKIEKT
jgi:hypothetical protein